MPDSIEAKNQTKIVHFNDSNVSIQYLKALIDALRRDEITEFGIVVQTTEIDDFNVASSRSTDNIEGTNASGGIAYYFFGKAILVSGLLDRLKHLVHKYMDGDDVFLA